ncbi:MAG: RAD50-interacting protein 1 [Watsoniomyces obsoletus]|nr:MAG: RAD50-interacting protein 1 [Watsoniomyces obsoletus]
MSTPNKRRKKNDSKASPLTVNTLDEFLGKPKPPVRNLDHFFGKQRAKNEADAASAAAAASSPPAFGATASTNDDNAPPSTLTDEELARSLQEEWNREVAGPSTTKSSSFGQKLQGNDSFTVKAEGSEEEEELYVQETETTDGDQRRSKQKDKEKNGPRPATTKYSLALQSTSSAEDEITLTIPFDESSLVFDPAKYIPALQAHWSSHGNDASYALLTRCFVLVSSTQGRIKIVNTLVNFLRLLIEADPDSLLPAVWLATNSIAPPFISMELGIGASAISKALKNVCGLDSNALKTLYNKYGDPGDVAFEAKKRQSYMLRKPKPLTIKGVYQALVRVANSKGQGSQETKQRIVERLLQDARGPEESRYIMRTLAQHLRIGAVKTTMLIALSRAFTLSKPPGADFSIRSISELSTLKKDVLTELYSSAEETAKACYARRPDYNALVPCLLEVGVCQELRLRCSLDLHIPLHPMLGNITRDLNEMLTKLQGRDFTCEYKYDGQRAQIHCDERGKVSIFSRHLENMTDKYPDLVQLVPEFRGQGVSSFIMEGEVVAIDRTSGELKTFQTLAGRGRKDVMVGDVEVDVCLFAFDLMFLNGEELLSRDLRERRELLRSMFVEIPKRFTWVKSIDATSMESEMVLEFFKSAVEEKCEGIMVKVLDSGESTTLTDDSAAGLPTTIADKELTTKNNKGKGKKGNKDKDKEKSNTNTNNNTRRKPLLATYEPDKRLDSWLKVKKDYDTSSTTDNTLDLIPIGAWHGTGRKAAWWSPILLAARNPETGELSAVCKCMSGFTDQFYKENRVRYSFPKATTDDEDEDENKGNIKGEDKEVDDRNRDKEILVHKTQLPYIDYPSSAQVPDIWFQPSEVWEIGFADITLSPTYTAARGLVDEDKGLSLRFPRFLRKREDKGLEEASEVGDLARGWWKQLGGSRNGGGNGKVAGVDGPGDGDGDGMEEEDLLI